MKGSAKTAGVAAISDVLNKALDNLGLFPKAKKYQVFTIWPKVLGDVSRHAKPRRLSGDVLFVATASSAWSQELTFMRQSIIEKLNSALGGEYVREIRFSEHLWDASEDQMGSNGIFFPMMSTGESAGFMDALPDADLARTARRFLSTMVRRRQYLMKKGYILCETCGCLYPSSKVECPFCRVKREWLARGKAIAILEKAPQLQDEEILALTGSEDKEFVQRARRELEARFVTLARNALAREGRKSEDDVLLADTITRLAALRCGKAVEELTREELESAVGRRFALAVRKGRWHCHGST